MIRRVNVSEILDYQRCPAYWASRWWAKKKLIDKREHAADVGKVTHKVWESAMKAYQSVGKLCLEGLQEQEQWEKSMHHTMRAEWLRMGFDEDKNDLRKLTALSHRAAWWWGQPLPFDKVLAVEEMLETELGTIGEVKIVLFGKPDAVCERDGKIKHHQLKTYGGYHPGLKVKLIKRSLHEAAYYLLAKEKYGKDYVGTHLTMLRSLPLKEKTSEGMVMRAHASMCVDEDLFITKRLRQRAEGEILSTVQKMLGWGYKLIFESITPQDLPQHEHQCGGPYSNSECHFLEACMGYASLDDRTLYVDGDPLEHYAEGVSS